MCLRHITEADFSAPASRSVEMTVVVWVGEIFRHLDRSDSFIVA
jgi:hypothetical protein